MIPEQTVISKGQPETATLDHAISFGNRLRAAALARLRESELKRVCIAFLNSDISCLVFKGSALAYQIYTRPDLRPRTKMDLLIRLVDLQAARRILQELGYISVPAPDGGAGSTQSSMDYYSPGGTKHAIDLHWDLGTRHELRNGLPFDSIYARSTPLPNFDIRIMAPCPVHALYISCLHLVGHRAACPRLIWLYDIILLLEALSDSELECFLSLVRSQKQDTLVCEAISATLPMFESRKVSMVLQRLRHPEGVPVRENYPSLVMRSKFNGMPDLLGKFRILLAHAFPPSR